MPTYISKEGQWYPAKEKIGLTNLGDKDILPFLGDHFGKVIALLTFIGLKLFAIGTETSLAKATMTA